MEKVTEYFKNNPDAVEVHSAGGFLFQHKKDALAHAATLENKDIETHSNMATEQGIAQAKAYLETAPIKGVWVTENAGIFTSEEVAKSIDENAVYVDVNMEVLQKNQEDQSGNPTLELLEKTELIKDNYIVLKELVAALKIETVNQKAETLIEALTQFKAALKTT